MFQFIIFLEYTTQLSAKVFFSQTAWGFIKMSGIWNKQPVANKWLTDSNIRGSGVSLRPEQWQKSRDFETVTYVEW